MSVSLKSDRASGEDICLVCGLCCNGVIFADVKLQPGDNARELRALGLPLRSRGGEPCCAQPCAAFDGCRCRVYADRPKHCREFECLLLKSVKAGRTSTEAALRTIGTARKRAERVMALLGALGDTGEQLSLGKRFRRTSRRLEKVGLDNEMTEIYGELTLAVHDLNLLLSEAFYPGP